MWTSKTQTCLSLCILKPDQSILLLTSITGAYKWNIRKIIFIIIALKHFFLGTNWSCPSKAEKKAPYLELWRCMHISWENQNLLTYLSQHMRKGYLSHMRPAKAQTSLCLAQSMFRLTRAFAVGSRSRDLEEALDKTVLACSPNRGLHTI